MKKFKFSLQALLEIRDKLESEQKNRLALAATEYQKLLDKKQFTFTQIQHAREQCDNGIKNNTVSIYQLQQLDKLYSDAEKLAFSLEPEINEKKKKLDQERELYHQRHKEKKALEILKEKEIQEYKQAMIRNENMIMDEIAKNQYIQTQKDASSNI